MKKRFFAAWVTIVIFCVVFVPSQANAQYYDFCSSDLKFYAGFNGGVSLLDDAVSPVFGVRLGTEVGIFVGELDFSYLSVKTSDKERFCDKDDFSTMTIGANLGVKVLNEDNGYLALMLHTGCALQEDWKHGGPDCYYDFWDYGYYDYYHCPPYHGAYYFGVGAQGSINVSSKVALFGEARIQSLPTEGHNETKWGGIFQGGLKVYF